MSDPGPPRRYRFGIFEAEAATGELRRQGMRVKLHAQPFQVLLMLLERPGELLTREQIARSLWPDGVFVDTEHGVNSAVNRIREALGDTAGSPRFVETLARRGYRFVAPVERIGANGTVNAAQPEPLATNPDMSAKEPAEVSRPPALKLRSRILATEEDLPKASHGVVQTIFILFQLMYLAFYVSALANLAEIRGLLSSLPNGAFVFRLLVVTAAILIPVRAFVLCAVLFRPPSVREKLLRIWPFLLLFDVLWSLSPFLLLHHINFGLALACMALLVYSPFAQRSLVLMGAGSARREMPVTSR
ncbi:MAG TPA: winged helix-turn-helix domain-containing protein [Terracidiphilus sp.]|nr:winged helix-turn-helix domain-containing protein [Terracidiphilus sp.]